MASLSFQSSLLGSFQYRGAFEIRICQKESKDDVDDTERDV